MKNLRLAAPFYKPYLAQLTVGLGIVVVSSGIASIIPWLLRRGIDAIGNNAPPTVVWRVAASIVAAAIFGGALRYWMRELMNGVSRRIEYDLRNALFTHLETLDAGYFARTRTGGHHGQAHQ